MAYVGLLFWFLISGFTVSRFRVIAFFFRGDLSDVCSNGMSICFSMICNYFHSSYRPARRTISATFGHNRVIFCEYDMQGSPAARPAA